MPEETLNRPEPARVWFVRMDASQSNLRGEKTLPFGPFLLASLLLSHDIEGHGTIRGRESLVEALQLFRRQNNLAGPGVFFNVGQG